jgi:hypothetical protein
MTLSKKQKLSVIILILLIFTAGCISSRQPQDPNHNFTVPVTPGISTITLSEKNVGDNDTYWIRIDPVAGTKSSGDIFNITAQTNLPPDENIFIRIYNTSPRAKGREGISITGQTKVTTKGSNNNKISFRVNSQILSANNYTILISAGEKGPSNVTNFWIVPLP